VLTPGTASEPRAQSGFPLFVSLMGHSPFPTNPPNNDTFEFYITSLPENGGLFTNEEPIQLVTEEDVAEQKILLDTVAYVSNIGYFGPDSFTYVAISANTGLHSEPHMVKVDVSDPPPRPPVDCVEDACGVCGGDNSTCTGGCDGRGGRVDECGVCAGDGASCTCAIYKTFRIDEMDCVLFEYSVNRTLARLEYAIETLMDALVGLQTFDGWYDAEFDLGIMIDFLNDFGKGCHPDYDRALDDFLYNFNSRPLAFATRPCDQEPEPLLPRPELLHKY